MGDQVVQGATKISYGLLRGTGLKDPIRAWRRREGTVLHSEKSILLTHAT